jgi:aminopeptidase YwaD
MKKICLLIGGLLALQATAQVPVQTLAPRLQYHVYYLADDSLQGRQTGSKGERMAAAYLIDQFQKMGLSPAGDAGKWTQAFSFTARQEYGKRNSLQMAGGKQKWLTTWYTLPLSGSGSVSADLVDVGYGIQNTDLGHNDYTDKKNLQGKIFLIRLHSPDGNNPHGKFGADAQLDRKIRLAEQNGAVGVIFYPGEATDVLPPDQLDRRTQQLNVPAIVLRWSLWEKMQAKPPKKAKIETEIVRHQVTGNNVVAYLDKGGAHTLVIGAHYDHLGMGEYGSSLHVGEPGIHNGADDNASGTAGLLELARYFSNQRQSKFNFLFMAFSGEELGLLGSAYFAKNPTIPLEQVNAMLNMDMIGRLDSVSKQLGVNGVGTSPIWKTLADSLAYGLSIKTTESGTGASDHTSFYLQDIPVLHFFTGTHSDYHKPGDDAHKLNYAGMAEVVNYIIRIVNALPTGEKLPFTKTSDADSRNAPRFKVTLGIMPDYFYEGRGIKVDGVTPGRPGANAGLQKGDLITRLGDYELADMQAYMQALAVFEKGSSTNMEVIRGQEKLKLEVNF